MNTLHKSSWTAKRSQIQNEILLEEVWDTCWYTDEVIFHKFKWAVSFTIVFLKEAQQLISLIRVM